MTGGVRVSILAEGQTEEFFVRDLLAPYLWQLGVYATATRICTRQVQGQRRYRGGHAGSYKHIRRDVLGLLDSHDVVTTMLDYYGLPADFPGAAKTHGARQADRALSLERAFAEDIGSPRFLPNLILHEFEALLFSDVQILHGVLGGAEQLRELRRIEAEFSSPEEINDSPETAPSKRLLALYPLYTKPVDGLRIAGAIGLKRMRERCARFHGWLCKLEGVATKPCD